MSQKLCFFFVWEVRKHRTESKWSRSGDRLASARLRSHLLLVGQVLRRLASSLCGLWRSTLHALGVHSTCSLRDIQSLPGARHHGRSLALIIHGLRVSLWSLTRQCAQASARRSSSRLFELSGEVCAVYPMDRSARTQSTIRRGLLDGIPLLGPLLVGVWVFRLCNRAAKAALHHDLRVR